MKRFFCTICKRVKRVRTLPKSVAVSDTRSPNDRIGQCARHSVPSSVSVIRRDQKRAV